jgi:xanthine dehydrogenase iron-sulfur cluster and FAD-binding subunit A
MAQNFLTFFVNGEIHRVGSKNISNLVDHQLRVIDNLPKMTLLQYLRYDSKGNGQVSLTGSKLGCGEGYDHA